MQIFKNRYKEFWKTQNISEGEQACCLLKALDDMLTVVIQALNEQE